MKTKKLNFHFHCNDNFLKNVTTCIENINIYFYICLSFWYRSEMWPEHVCFKINPYISYIVPGLWVYYGFISLSAVFIISTSHRLTVFKYRTHFIQSSGIICFIRIGCEYISSKSMQGGDGVVWWNLCLLSWISLSFMGIWSASLTLSSNPGFLEILIDTKDSVINLILEHICTTLHCGGDCCLYKSCSFLPNFKMFELSCNSLN